MDVPLTITFRGMDTSEAAEQQIRNRAQALGRVHGRITACKVVLESSHHRHQKGNIFHVAITITVPGKEIVVNRDPGQHHAHEDAYVAIRDAFDAARRRLEDHVRVQGGAIKAHEAPTIGRIVTLFPEQGYGFLATDTGEEIYLHEHAVANGGFGKLKLGDRVRYVLAPDPGEKGPQASTVVPI
jgi:cold shock CspA family protein/ribosome-associated translation inhibitor RaiA